MERFTVHYDKHETGLNWILWDNVMGDGIDAYSTKEEADKEAIAANAIKIETIGWDDIKEVMKGDRLTRLHKLNERLFEAEAFAWPGTVKMDILRRRHVKIMAAIKAIHPNRKRV
jgi:hypothetical protein